MDTEAANNILDSLLGPGQGAAMPADFLFELWVGDPRVSGSVEFDYPGYAAQTISTSTSWSGAASGGVKVRDTAVAFPVPTGESTDAATHWAMRDPDTDALYFVGFLGVGGLDIPDPEGEDVDAPTILPRVRVADALIPFAA